MDVINENTEYQNAKEDYQSKGINIYENQIKELIHEKHEYLQKIETLQHSIRMLEEKKSLFCHSTGGHKWVTERESGMYGETFTYCEKCKKGY